MYIVIVGAGQLGYYLTKTLLSKGFEVTLLDWDYERVCFLQQELGGIVLYAFGSSIEGLERAGCNRADVIVATTGDDEDNLVVCQLGKKYFKIPKAIARINNPKNERIFNKLGIGTTISSTKSIASAIENYVVTKQIKTLLSFYQDEMLMLEVELNEKSPVIGKKIVEINLPYECTIAIILRGKNVIFAKGDTVLQELDKLITISTHKEKENLWTILLGEEV